MKRLYQHCFLENYIKIIYSKTEQLLIPTVFAISSLDHQNYLNARKNALYRISTQSGNTKVTPEGSTILYFNNITFFKYKVASISLIHSYSADIFISS